MRSNKVENNILAAARTEISRRGLRFTMDSLASHLRISKKTLYEIVGCKRELISQVIDAALISIAENEIRIYQDFNLSLMDKFAKLVELYRMNLKPFDTATIRDMMQLYPELWEKIETLRLSKWQSLIRTIQFQISKDTNENNLQLIINGVLLEMLLCVDLNNNGSTVETVIQEVTDKFIEIGLAEHNITF